MRPIRIGTGAGFSGDRIEPAVELVANGDSRLARLRMPRRAHDRAGAAGPHRRSRPATTRCSSGGCAPCCRSASRTASGSSPTWASPTRKPRRGGPPRSPARSASRSGSRQSRATTSAPGRPATPPIIDFAATVAQLGNRLISANAYLGAGPSSSAGGRRRHRDHRPGRRSRPVPGAAHARVRLGDGRLAASGTAPSSAICSSAPVRSPAAISPIPATRTSPIWHVSAFPIAEVGADGGAVITKLEAGRRGDRADGQGATALRGA